MMNKIMLLIALFFPTVLFGQSWEELVSQADSFQNQGDFTKAILYLENAKQKASEVYGKDHENYISTLNELAFLYKSAGNYKSALQLYWEAKNILKKSVGSEHPDYVETLNNMAELYTTLGNYMAALSLYKEKKDIIENEIGGKNSIYATLLSNMAYLHQQLGEDDEALLLFEESKNIFQVINGIEDPRYASLMNNLGLLYMEMGNYEAAYPLLTAVKEIRFRTSIDKPLDYAYSLNSLAGFYKSTGNYKEALSLYEEAKIIIKENLGDTHPSYAILLDNLATLYTLIKNFEAALPLYNEAIQIEKQSEGIKNLNYAGTINNLAILYSSMGNNEDAIHLLEESSKIQFNTMGNKHPDYAATLHNLALVYCSLNEYKNCKDKIIEAMNIIMSHFNNLDILSEKQKINYKKVDVGLFYSFYSTCLKLYSHDKSIAKYLFDTYLFSQNILFSSSKKMKEVILNSNDNELIDLYNKYVNTKVFLARAYSLTGEELINNKINVDSLERISENDEKELSKKTKVFENYLSEKNYNWEDIRKKLKRNEATVSVIRFPYYNQVWTDSIKYVALIITKEMVDSPKLVELKNSSEFEGKFSELYRTSILPDSEKLKSNVGCYKAFWEEIEKEIKDKDLVYFCPDGVYYTINLNTIQYPDGQYLYEKKDIVILNSLRELIEEDEPVYKSKIALLVGSPNYSMSKKSKKIQATDFNNNYSDAGSYQITREFRDFTLTYLPGTKIEVEKINELLKKQGWVTQYLTGNQALEDAVKSVKNPRILHIATHGFFADDIQQNTGNQLNNSLLFGQNTIRAIENPMLRSGLMFCGSQNTLNGEYNLQGQTDDGILTGYEAMDLTLDSTELVVLSACETGLGEIKDGEGVYGLQRAFKLAGARNLIMSLWKVDDNATQLLMRKFYEFWLAGNTKRKAFKMAQDHLKTETVYKQPYYWGGFVYIGMDRSIDKYNSGESDRVKARPLLYLFVFAVMLGLFFLYRKKIFRFR